MAWVWCLLFSRGAGTVSAMSERIEIDPRICGGQPVTKGTRLAVVASLEQLADG